MKILRTLLPLVALLFCSTVQAQKVEDFGVFKHMGAGVSVGTEGIGINVATPVTNYLELGLGVNFMPGVKIKGDVDVNDIKYTYTDAGTGLSVPVTIPMSEVNVQAKLARTVFDFKANVYPFGTKNDLFVAAGFSFGGKKIAKISGHSEDVKNFMARTDVPEAAKDQVYAEIDKYQVDFDHNGDVKGYIRVNAFRPYLGLGYGRLVPKHRLGFRVELGCQFMGKMKIYQNGKEVNINELDKNKDDDVSKFVDKFKVYPVLKFTLAGRLF